MTHGDASLNSVESKTLGGLVEGHRMFLSFLERRVENRAIAEEILQDAYVKSIEKAASIRDDESAVAWFYRLLRNSIIDHYRKRHVEAKGLHKAATDADILQEPLDVELKTVICGCMKMLIPNLKPEYAELIQSVDLDEKNVVTVAVSLGITANNAMVRLHRARKALRALLEKSCATCAVHGCLDCSCGKK